MSPPRVGFNHKVVLILSVIQLSCGVLSMLCGGIQIGIVTAIGVISYGIWSGLFFIIAGILGIISWKYKNNCIIAGHMVMSIIACLFGWVLLGLSATSVAINSACYRGCAPLALGAVLLIISLLEIVVSIVSSAFCCKAVCCGTRPIATMQYVVSSSGGQPGQQVVVLAPGSYPQQGYVMQAGNQPAYQMQGTVPQGSQIVYNQGQPAPQGQIAYHAQAVAQGHIAYNVQPVPQGQNVMPTQNTTPVLPPAYTALGHTDTK